MTCPSELDLMRSCDGELAPARAREVADHVRECAACSALVSQLEEENAMLRAVFATPVSSPSTSDFGALARRAGITLGAALLAR